MRFVDLTSFLGLYADFAVLFHIAYSESLCQDSDVLFLFNQVQYGKT